MAHRCHAIGCTKEVPPRTHMCKPHWDLVPRRTQRELWTHYRPGQERDKQPSAAYLRAAGACVRAVGEAEGRPESEIAFEVSMYESWADLIESEDQ